METVAKTPDAPKKRGRPRKNPVPAQIAPETPVKTKSIRARTPRITAKTLKSAVPAVVAEEKPDGGALPYIFAVGRRKRAVARVFAYRPGTGEVEINEKSADKYFAQANLNDIVYQPLEHSPFKKSVRLAVKVRGGGLAGQAEAVRLGIARALLKLDSTLRPTFRAYGYLTRDPREKERKKPGLKRARRAPQWQKR